jgi:type I restriction enzyme M protein
MASSKGGQLRPVLSGEQNCLPFPVRANAQRERHFQRREKVLGQFFTPPALAAWMVEIATAFALRRDAALDPACGDGAFLFPLCQKGFHEVWGIDVDATVLPTCQARLLVGDALKLLPSLRDRFDVVVTNPPFSAKYGRVTNPKTLQSFELGRGRRSEAIEVLFLELCVHALRDGGVLAIILPEGIFANLPMQRVRQWLLRHATPLAVISLSRHFFAAKTCVLFARKAPAPPDATVLFAHVETETDLPEIAQALLTNQPAPSVCRKPVQDNLSPLWHLNEVSLSCVFPMRPLGELLSEIRCGSTLYGTQRRFASSGIPFVSAKTVTPFGVDLKRDGRFVAKGSPMDKPQARTRVGDVLFVRVGVGCIGRVAVVLHDDETGVADDYLYILRFKPALLPEFFALYAQTHFFRQQLERLKRGTGTVTVPQQLLLQILVPIPPMEIQQRFATVYRAICERFRQGQTPDEELRKLVMELERVLEGQDE